MRIRLKWLRASVVLICGFLAGFALPDDSDSSGGVPPGDDAEASCPDHGCKPWFRIWNAGGGSNPCGTSVSVTGAFDDSAIEGACNCHDMECKEVVGTVCVAVINFSVTVTASSRSYTICEYGGWTGAGNTRSITVSAPEVDCAANTGAYDGSSYIKVVCSPGTCGASISGSAALINTSIGCGACSDYDNTCQ